MIEKRTLLKAIVDRPYVGIPLGAVFKYIEQHMMTDWDAIEALDCKTQAELSRAIAKNRTIEGCLCIKISGFNFMDENVKNPTYIIRMDCLSVFQ